MRKWLLVGVVAAVPSLATAQFPGGERRGGESGGRSMMMGGDPSRFMDMLFRGKDAITRDDVDERLRPMFDMIASRFGATNGQLTRQQVEAGSRQAMERMRSGGTPGGDAPTPGMPGMFSRGGDSNSSDQFAESMFRRADIDNDGVLSAEEMSESLSREKEKWDKNSDGVIDRDEYKSYISARMLALQQDRATDRPKDKDPDDEDVERRPVVYRSGKLPRDVPPWFSQLDTDQDIQIGLYEWKVSGKSIKEFKEMDRNGDNFLTVEEVLFTVRLARVNAGGTATASADGERPRGMPGFGGAPGGMPGFGGAPGGMPGFGSAPGGMPSFGSPGGRTGFGGMPGFGGTPGGSPAGAPGGIPAWGGSRGSFGTPGGTERGSFGTPGSFRQPGGDRGSFGTPEGSDRGSRNRFGGDRGTSGGESKDGRPDSSGRDSSRRNGFMKGR